MTDPTLPRRKCGCCKQYRAVLGGSFRAFGKGFVCAQCQPVKK